MSTDPRAPNHTVLENNGNPLPGVAAQLDWQPPRLPPLADRHLHSRELPTSRRRVPPRRGSHRARGRQDNRLRRWPSASLDRRCARRGPIVRAERGSVPAVDLLYRMLLEEAASKRERSLAYRLQEAHMPWNWSLESFPFERQPGVDKRQIQTLAGLDFLRRSDNVLLVGPPGTGKTGIALGLLRQACVNGYRGRFYNAQALLDELYASLADRSSLQLLRRLS